ncbi:hypothetical protein JAAARDRAFT_33373 [Jaapia argillacea MUCL 33604]|uniref:Uncharacterized protein n=1 Tax=Jaapia argillacea MUCL 33604 TaxID=933084 RepID=A0A067QB39_9AGAM|nr:hypothetical protein JAAARDRAFT_33373 [Jaapia argillacea MUCL 33604]
MTPTARAFTSPPLASPPELIVNPQIRNPMLRGTFASLMTYLLLSEAQLEVSDGFEWNRFYRWTRGFGNYHLQLSAMHWYKESTVPSHEYILLEFTSRSLKLSPFTIRLERDSTSWFSLFGERNEDRRNCKDKLTLRLDSLKLIGPTDKLMASILIPQHQYSVITLLHIAHLQQMLNEKAPVYDLFTYNCWWYAGCIWENVAYWLRQSGAEVVFTLDLGTPDDEVIEEMTQAVPSQAGVRPLDWEATIFPRKLLHAHIMTARRALRGRETTRKLDGVLEASKQIREYCMEEIHRDVIEGGRAGSLGGSGRPNLKQLITLTFQIFVLRRGVFM